MPDNEQRTIVVTGGSRGIGRSICLAFANPENRIFFNYAAADTAAEETVALAAEKGCEATGIRADVTSEQAVSDFFKKIIAATGRVDVLVNNAGITRDTLMLRMSEKDWDMVLDINLKGAFLVTKTASRVMMKQRYGRIVNISSVVGLTGNAGQVNYSASKAGLIGLTKSAAKELASRGITVNAVAPGYIETEMTKQLSEAAREEFLRSIALKRPGTPDDVASTVLFLASDDAAYITGQVMAVDGGLTM